MSRCAWASGLNPLSPRFEPFQWSQQTGSLIESSQRFNLFLGTLKKMARPGQQLTEAQIEYAAIEARKWMIVYQD